MVLSLQLKFGYKPVFALRSICKEARPSQNVWAISFLCSLVLQWRNNEVNSHSTISLTYFIIYLIKNSPLECHSERKKCSFSFVCMQCYNLLFCACKRYNKLFDFLIYSAFVASNKCIQASLNQFNTS